MPSRTWEDLKEEVRERTDLVATVSRYVSLRQRGRNHVGLCPFHSEKTPSFNVNPDRGFFHCFGCGKSGDVFTFLMEIESVSFRDALERLARELGLELPESEPAARERGERERLAEIHRRVARHYWDSLWKQPIGQKARDYLEKRGVSEPTARAFGLGYAPPSGLAELLDEWKIPREDARRLGLVGQGDDGHRYDWFRDRLVFPILDLWGRVAGFGGRLLGESSGNAPKYLNSPESPLFRKRSLLFGLAKARDAIRGERQALVVEGYLDVIGLAEAGIETAVAPLGTAITGDQVKVLRRFADEIVVLFDGDDAGRNAAARSFPVFAEVGVFADAAFLPAGEDPDTFVRSRGPEGIRQLVGERTPLADHFLASLATRDAGLAERKRAAEAVADLLGRIGDPIFTGLLARRAAAHLDLPEEELVRRSRGKIRRAEAEAPSAAPPPLPEIEARVFELLALDGNLVERLPADAASLLESERGRAILERILGGTDVRDLLGELPARSQDWIARIAAAPSYDAATELRDTLAKLATARERDRRSELNRRIREADEAGDAEELSRLQREKTALLGKSE